VWPRYAFRVRGLYRRSRSSSSSLASSASCSGRSGGGRRSGATRQGGGAGGSGSGGAGTEAGAGGDPGARGWSGRISQLPARSTSRARASRRSRGIRQRARAGSQRWPGTRRTASCRGAAWPVRISSHSSPWASCAGSSRTGPGRGVRVSMSPGCRRRRGDAMAAWDGAGRTSCPSVTAPGRRRGLQLVGPARVARAPAGAPRLMVELSCCGNENHSGRRGQESEA
jgi:hypothetical protein